MSLTSWLLVGALFQVLLTTIRVPFYVSLLLIVSVLGYRTGHALLITFKLIPNPYMKDAILTFASAQIPNAAGEFSATPAAEPIAVLHLGAKLNHPLGGFAPHAKDLIKHADNMYKTLDSAAKQTSGYLGGNSMMAVDKNDCIELSFISYWRSIDAIHDFAYSDAHRAGWEWWNSVPKDDITHIGINHEIFQAAPGMWETIYINHQPTLMMGTHSFRPGDKELGGEVEDSWVANVLDARRGKLRTSAGRLNKGREELKKKYNYVPKRQTGLAADEEGRDFAGAEKAVLDEKA